MKHLRIENLMSSIKYDNRTLEPNTDGKFENINRAHSKSEVVLPQLHIIKLVIWLLITSRSTINIFEIYCRMMYESKILAIIVP